MNKNKRKQEKLLRQRKKVRTSRLESANDFFYEYTGSDPSGNMFYDLKDDPRFTEILQHVDKSVPTNQEKETRDKALHHLTKALVMLKMVEDRIK